MLLLLSCELEQKQKIEGMVLKQSVNLPQSTKRGSENRNKVTGLLSSVIMSVLIKVTRYLFSSMCFLPSLSGASLCDYDPGTRCLNRCLLLLLSPFHIWKESAVSPWTEPEGEGKMRERERCSKSWKRTKWSEGKLTKQAISRIRISMPRALVL